MSPYRCSEIQTKRPRNQKILNSGNPRSPLKVKNFRRSLTTLKVNIYDTT